MKAMNWWSGLRCGTHTIYGMIYICCVQTQTGESRLAGAGAGAGARAQAQVREYETRQFYQRAQQRATDAGVRKLLGDLAAAEAGHESIAQQLGKTHLTPEASAEHAAMQRRISVPHTAQRERVGRDVHGMAEVGRQIGAEPIEVLRAPRVVDVDQSCLGGHSWTLCFAVPLQAKHARVDRT